MSDAQFISWGTASSMARLALGTVNRRSVGSLHEIRQYCQKNMILKLDAIKMSQSQLLEVSGEWDKDRRACMESSSKYHTFHGMVLAWMCSNMVTRYRYICI
jgi:hypothetical protein